MSYALVTLVAAGAISVASAVGQAARGAGSTDSVGATSMLEKSAAAAARYLSGPGPDAEALRFWVAIPLMDDLSHQPGGVPLAVAVLGPDGTLLTAESCTRAQYNTSSAPSCHAVGQGRAEALLADPLGRRAIGSTVRDITHGPATIGSASGRGFVAAAVRNEKQTVGILVAIFDREFPVVSPPHQVASFLDAAKAKWSPSWLPLILLAILLGTATGFGLSHHLARRLRAMAGTARTWSSGDLQPTIEVRGRDELGQLGADLNQMAEQIRNLLAARREIATMQERQRVQRDLHDGVKQELFAASMQLAAAKATVPSGSILGYLDEAQAANLRAQRELTAIIEQLRPPRLSPAGLSAAIAELCQEFSRRTGLTVSRDVPDDLQVSTPVQEALFRILQEALTNVDRHAKAGAVTVRLTESGGKLTISVADDGVGLPPAVRTDGVGLTSMRERAQALGGRFEIRPARPGTVITVVIPSVTGQASHD